jgi:hypothetical protein
MVRGRAGLPLGRARSHVRQSATQQGEHVLHCLRVDIGLCAASCGPTARHNRSIVTSPPSIA